MATAWFLLIGLTALAIIGWQLWSNRRNIGRALMSQPDVKTEVRRLRIEAMVETYAGNHGAAAVYSAQADMLEGGAIVPTIFQ